MKNVIIILSCFLSVCVFQQIQAQEQKYKKNTDITLIDIGWNLLWNKSSQKIHGRYKMINNLDKKITIKRIYIHQNNWCQITPYINAHVQGNDSLVLQPFEQREFTYGCSYLEGRYFSIELFIKVTAESFKNNLYPKIDFYITYYEDDNYNENKTYSGQLYFLLDNLADFPNELIEYLIPYVNCEKYKDMLEVRNFGKGVFNINEWAKWNMTLFEQKICPCILKSLNK